MSQKLPSRTKSALPKRYVLVEFRTGVELVSSTWLTADDECWGPRHTKDLKQSYDEAVKNHVQPTTKWKKFKILRTFGTYDDFEVAQRKRQRALEVSDLDTESEATHPKHHNVRAMLSSSDSEEDRTLNSDESHEPAVQETSRGQPKIATNPPLRDGTDNDTLLVERAQMMEAIENLQQTVQVQTVTLDRCLSYLQKIERRVTELSMSQGIHDDDGVSEWQTTLPLTSVDEVDDAETRLLGDEAKKKQLVCLLKKCGGTTVDDSIRRVLREIFTKEVATKYSWKGRRGKKNLSSMALTNAMYTAVQLVPEMTKEKFESRLKEWFRHAPARLLKETPPPPPIVPQHIA